MSKAAKKKKSKTPNTEKGVVKIQYLFRKKYQKLQKNKKSLYMIYQTQLQLMYRVQSQFHNSVYTQEKYNKLMHQLEKCSQEYQTLLETEPSFKNLDEKKTQHNLFINKLLNITIEIGLELKYLLPLFSQDKNTLSPLQKFYHTFYIPTTCHRLLYPCSGVEGSLGYRIDTSLHSNLEVSIKKKPPATSILSKKKKLKDKSTEIKQKETNNESKDETNKIFGLSQNNQSFEEDIKYLTSLGSLAVSKKEPHCVLAKNNSNLSLIETVHGGKLYYFTGEGVLVMNGYFREDPLNLSRMNGSFKIKKTQLEQQLSHITQVKEYFRTAFLKQISVRDFVINSTEELASQCIKSYKELQRLKQKTISTLVKEFLGSSLDKQRETLTLFLLTEGDTDTQYLAYLMFDMISNESYLLKPQPVAEQVYSSLHWSVQKLFKIALQNVNKYTNRLLNFNEEDIPYEKRICLLKAPDHVKAKAMEKYKEVSQKTNESASKAQQFLDGILKIPFGVYYKETILCFLADYVNRFNVLVQSIHNTIEDTDTSDEKNKDQLSNLVLSKCKEVKSYSKVTSNVVENFYHQIDQKIDSHQSWKTQISDQITSFSTAAKVIKQIKQVVGVKKLLLDGEAIVQQKSVGGKKVNVSLDTLRNQILDYIQTQLDNPTLVSTLNINADKIDTGLFTNYNKLKTEWTDYLDKKQNYLQQSRKYLDDAVHGHKEAKNQLERIIAQWMNGDMTGYCFGFEGPPGTGKTSLAKKGLTRCLQDDDGRYRPFSFIAIGGSSNGATLEGHSYTYVGSTWGRIVDILMETQCMNPIIFIDELDKVSHTEHGKEIIGILTHLTDSTQNDEFCDKYFAGIKLDLSKVLFIFSYNDPEKIDPILLDRIHRVQFKPLKKRDKIIIANRYMLPEIFQTVGFRKGLKDNEKDIIFPDEVLEFIIDNYTFEAGARKFREKLFEIVREINLRWLMGQKIGEQQISFPYTVTIDFLTGDIFSDRNKIHMKKISKTPRIGLVNGLYATATGIGGITIIESFRVPSNDRLGLELTGKQGDVMKESMKVAKTVAWNMLPPEIKVQINQQWNRTGNFGMHIHCPEAATPKDGPSAGAAITVAIISLLSNLPVNNLVAMTGEIDLNGSVHPIGGLETKLDGAKKAGVKIALCPTLNGEDLDRILRDDPHLVDENFQVFKVATIWDIIPYVFPDAPYRFINYTVENSVILPEYLSETEMELDGSRIGGQEIRWEQCSGPSLTIIKDPTQIKTKVSGLGIGVYQFKMFCQKNDKEESHSISVTIPEKPKAEITSETVWKGSHGWLDAGSSSGDIQKYQWSLISGEDCQIEQATDLRTRVSKLKDGVYVFELEVFDKFFRSHKTRKQISVVDIFKETI